MSRQWKQLAVALQRVPLLMLTRMLSCQGGNSRLPQRRRCCSTGWRQHGGHHWLAPAAFGDSVR